MQAMPFMKNKDGFKMGADEKPGLMKVGLGGGEEGEEKTTKTEKRLWELFFWGGEREREEGWRRVLKRQKHNLFTWGTKK